MMRSLRRAAATAALILAVPAALPAQDQLSPPAVTASKAFKLSGYTQFLFTEQTEGVSGLSVRRAKFSLAAELLKDLRFKVQVDLLRSPALLDAQVEFLLHEAASFRIGQFKVPFSLEMTTSSSDLDTINRSQPVNKLSPGLDIGSAGRDIGIVLFGRAAFLEYTVGVFNGAGINAADTNDRKDLAGRVIVRPLDFLSIGASFYDGSFAPSAGAASAVRDRVGMDLALLRGPFSLKAEFIGAEDGEVLREGWYVQAGWFFLPRMFQGVLRADSYDADRAASGDRKNVWTAGLNWILSGRTKLQANFELTRNEAGTTVNKALCVQLQAGF